MASILDEFKIFNNIPEDIKQNIKLFNVFESDFAIWVTNDDKVYAFDKIQYTGYEYENSEQNYVLIPELCDQNIQQFFRHTFNKSCPERCFQVYYSSLYARSSDKLFSSGSNFCGLLGQGFKTDDLGLIFKPKSIKFFDNKKIIDISFSDFHCLALSSEGLVYGWGDNSEQQFDKTGELKRFLSPVLINSEFGVNERVKYIHCCKNFSVLVTFDGFVNILNPNDLHLFYKISELSNVYKIYANCFTNAIVLKDNGFIEFFSCDLRKSIECSSESLVDSNFFDIKSNESELIVATNEGIQAFNTINGEISKFKNKNAFEYYLFQEQSTFKTIHLKENAIYYKNIEFNENTITLFESIKRIEFNAEEYRNKYYNPDVTKSLHNFYIGKVLPEILESKVKYYHQISASNYNNYSAIFVMNDNKVYAIGCNKFGRLGLGHERDVKVFTLIEELCDQNIEEFFDSAFYTSCMLARNNKNQIFSWGINVEGQLCRPYEVIYRSDYLKPKKIDFFDDKNIIEISCSGSHCLGLSEEGVVYGWGSNNYGQTGSRSENERELTPIRVQLSDSSDNRIKFIHSYFDTSGAVTVDGSAYLWGRVGGEENYIRIPILIGTNISKLLFEYNSICCEYLKKFAILKTNGIFKAKRISHSLKTKTIIEINEVFDILGTKAFFKNGVVYKIHENYKGIEKTNYSNFFQYFLYEHKIINETIYISSDGYLMRPNLEINLNSNSKLLTKTFVNIFDQKYESSFDLIKKIDQGSFGVVYKVISKTTSDLFAIKRMEINENLSEKLKEILIMSKLSKEYVVEYYDSWTESKVIDKEIVTFVYIQMELCSRNLQTIIQIINNCFDEKFKTLIYFLRIQIFIEIIECLNYLHSKNIIHRDLKPQNILITEGINGRFIKLCDFGLSKVNENSQNTKNIGTMYYMAPEVNDNFDSTTDVTHYNLKSDIYSLGVIATKLFDLNQSIKSIRKLEFLDKYLEYFPNTYLKEKFSKLLKQISQMLSIRPEKRPNCRELLAKTYEWRVDPNIVINDENYEEFIKVSKNA